MDTAATDAIVATLRSLENDLDAENVRAICDVFLDDGERQLVALRRAMDADDVPTIRAGAHAFKGSVAIFGARGAATAAGSLEREDDRSHRAAHFAALEAELRALRATVRAYIADDRSG